MTDTQNKSIVLKIIVAITGCLGLLLVLGIIGGLYFRTQVVESPILSGESGPISIDAPIKADTFTLSSAGDGLSRFTHHGDCRSKIAGLTLQYLQLDFPESFELRSSCADSNYVTLARVDEAGDIVHLIGVGFANLPLRIDDPVVEELIMSIQNAFSLSATARPMSSSPFAARGTKLISRTQYLKMHSRTGAYREGDYSNHIILVPGPDNQGLSILSMQRIEGDRNAALSEQAQILTTVIDSIRFSE